MLQARLKELERGRAAATTPKSVDLEDEILGALGRRLDAEEKGTVELFRVEAPDVEAAVGALAEAGATVLYAPTRTDQLTIEGVVRDADGNTITVWRALTEDEYDFVPELPKEKGWSPEAEELVKSLLKTVPALFRGLARRKVVKEAEERAGADGHIDRDLAIRAFISAQSPPNRKRLLEPLRAHGIEPAAYQDEFDA